jgi:CHAD domain-containing protein
MKGRTAGPEVMAMRAYALQQTRTLLRRLAYQVSQTVRSGNPDSVHDLRVAIRRFQQCLRAFRQYFPKHGVKRVRRRLRDILALAAKVRDHDIALELLKPAGSRASSPLTAALTGERRETEKELLSALRRASANTFSRKWRSRLEL